MTILNLMSFTLCGRGDGCSGQSPIGRHGCSIAVLWCMVWVWGDMGTTHEETCAGKFLMRESRWTGQSHSLDLGKQGSSDMESRHLSSALDDHDVYSA